MVDQGSRMMAKGLVLRVVSLLCGDKRRVGGLDALMQNAGWYTYG
jgi:hypothetical protein